jgi:hypothetical protein
MKKGKQETIQGGCPGEWRNVPKTRQILRLLWFMSALATMWIAPVAAQTSEAVLHNFGHLPRGANPYALSRIGYVWPYHGCYTKTPRVTACLCFRFSL